MSAKGNKKKTTRYPIIFAAGILSFAALSYALVIYCKSLPVSANGSGDGRNAMTSVKARLGDFAAMFARNKPNGIIPSSYSDFEGKQDSTEKLLDGDGQPVIQARDDDNASLLDHQSDATYDLQPSRKTLLEEENKALKAETSVYSIGAIPKGRLSNAQFSPSLPSSSLAGTHADSSLSYRGRSRDSSLEMADVSGYDESKRGEYKEQNAQGQKRSFTSQKKISNFRLKTSRRKPVEDLSSSSLQSSTFELHVGSLIPAIMKEGINSDLPGEIRAQVSQHVYDTATGEYLLIPQGATLFGRYDSQVSYGQKRVLIKWNIITFPDGSTLEIDTMAGSDKKGQAGFYDTVDNHYLKIFGSSVLLSIISASAQVSQPQSSVLQNQSVGNTAAAALGQNLNQTGNTLLRRNLNIQPTLEIRPGYRFIVKVNKTISFKETYKYF